MSLYGNVRRIGSQQFQFDRIYPNRVAMDAANAGKSDGVHVGRFALIEYGPRYIAERDENGNIVTIQNQNGERVPKWEESEEFASLRAEDFDSYGASYDSTVWQKIYSGNREKYIMIAELNASLPKLELNPEGSLIYSEGDSTNSDKVYDAFNNEIENINVEINTPYFDQIQDTEMAYILHFPQPPQLNVDPSSIDYNEKGFNVFYGSQKDTTESYIRWTTDDFYGNNYDENGIITSNTEEIVYPKTELTAILNSRTLRMHIPAFGNAISDLYDMLYGHASYERDNDGNIIYAKDEHGNDMVDAFGEKIPQIAYARDSEGQIIYDENGQPAIDSLRPYFKKYRDAYPELMDITKNPPESTGIPRTPLNDANDNMYWTKDVPGIDKILSNNSAGLAAILSEIFKVQNPLTGEIKYWLLNDWTSEEYNEEGNTPTLRNKPEIITYASKTEYQDLESIFNTQESLYGKAQSPYRVNRKNWLYGTNVTDANTQIPIFNTQGVSQDTSDNVGYTQNYEYYITRTPSNHAEVFEDGHWYTDFSTWTLKHISTFPSSLSHNGPNLIVKKNIIDAPPEQENIWQENTDAISITQTYGSHFTVTITGDFDNLNDITEDNDNLGKWVYLQVITNTTQTGINIVWENNVINGITKAFTDSNIIVDGMIDIAIDTTAQFNNLKLNIDVPTEEDTVQEYVITFEFVNTGS